jgi:hypothetical protein
MSDDHGDEWLHDHCGYRGTVQPTSSNDARNRAVTASANVVAPVSPDSLPPENAAREGIAAYEGASVGLSKLFSCERLPEGI